MGQAISVQQVAIQQSALYGGSTGNRFNDVEEGMSDERGLVCIIQDADLITCVLHI
jgi:hypothetical protein